MGTGKRLLTTLMLLTACVGCDQATKHLATSALRGLPMQSFLQDTVRLQYAENSGAFLSLGAALPAQWRFWLLTVAVGVMLLGFLFMAVRSNTLPVQAFLGMVLVAGGGLSNWLDRVLGAGMVVDFLNLGVGPLRTGIFNVADVAIVLGALAMVLRQQAPTPALAAAQQSPPSQTP